MSITVTHGRHKRTISRTSVAVITHCWVLWSAFPVHAALQCTTKVVSTSALNEITIPKRNGTSTSCSNSYIWVKRNGVTLKNSDWALTESLYIKVGNTKEYVSWTHKKSGDYNWHSSSFNLDYHGQGADHVVARIRFTSENTAVNHTVDFDACNNRGWVNFTAITRDKVTATWPIGSVYNMRPLSPGETDYIVLPAPSGAAATLERNGTDYEKLIVTIRGSSGPKVSIPSGYNATVSMTARDVAPGPETRHYTATLHCP